jgi:hypothetical protein
MLLGRGGAFLTVRSEDPLPREHLSLNNNQIQNTGGSILITPVSVASRRAKSWTAGVGFPVGQDVSVFHNVQTGSGAHLASYSVNTGGSISGGENLCKL